MNKFLIASALGLSVMLAGCDTGPDKFNRVTIRPALDHMMDQMRNPPAAKQFHGPSLSNYGATSLTLHENASNVVIVTQTTDHHLHVSYSAEGRWVHLIDSKCRLVDFDEKGCEWLTAEEWKNVSYLAQDYANRNGGKF
jgi:hypothetical protein